MRHNIIFGSCLLVALSAWMACVSDGSSSSSSSGGSSSGDSGVASSTSGAPVEAGYDVAPSVDGGSDADAAPVPFCVQNADASACEDFEGTGQERGFTFSSSDMLAVRPDPIKANALFGNVSEVMAQSTGAPAYRFFKAGSVPYDAQLEFALNISQLASVAGTTRPAALASMCARCEIFLDAVRLADQTKYELKFFAAENAANPTLLGQFSLNEFLTVRIDLRAVASLTPQIDIQVSRNGIVTNKTHAVSVALRDAKQPYELRVGADASGNGSVMRLAIDNLLVQKSNR
jgi:hypothetical protein